MTWHGMALVWNGVYDGVLVLGFRFSYPELEVMIRFQNGL